MLEQKKLVFIGDIHGQYNKLTQLLSKLNFYPENPQSSVKDHKLVFIGDLIDNKPELNTDHIKTLTLVKQLVDQGLAHCIMGNHEINAIGWATRNTSDTDWARPHSENNRKQHKAFLDAVEEGSDKHKYWIDWFKSLPLYLDFGEIKAIHACWDQTAIDELQTYLEDDHRLKGECFAQVFDKTRPLYDLIETLLKGPEIALPEGAYFFDKTGTRRTNMRVRWWQSMGETYQDIAQVQEAERGKIPNLPLPAQVIEHFNLAPSSQPTNSIQPIVVIGHYTLNDTPSLLSQRIACVDYNAASERGNLTGFIYHQGTQLNDNKNGFVVSAG